MKQSSINRAKELFPGSDIVRWYAFKIMSSRDNSTLLAKANHQLSALFARSGDKYALFYKKDCFECLSPHKKVA